MEEQRRMLAAHFAERLLALRPASVLDVGCGAGGLLGVCADAGIPCAGIEPDAKRAAAARARGLDVVASDGLGLAFDDGSFDWVTLRHVPHHLEQPRVVFAEAWRVARSGLLLAEPWFDDSLPTQRAARRADELCKRLDRARGLFHADVLSGGELVELLPDDARCELAPWLPLRRWSDDDLRVEWERARGDEPVMSADEAGLAELRRLARDGALTLPGTLIVTARKRG